MSSNTNQPAKIRINYASNDPDRGNFVQFPRWWVDHFFYSRFSWQGTNTKKGTTKCDNLPASFWKFLFYLWRHVTHVTPSQPEHHCSSGMRQFPVRPDAATLWTAAFSVSGVMRVQVGRCTPNHDDPTEFWYNPATTQEEWEAFFDALLLAYTNFNKEKRGCDTPKRISTNTGFFKLLVARAVDEQRAKRKLPPANSLWLQRVAEGKEVDGKGAPIKEETIHYRERRQLPGESDEDYTQRIDWEWENGDGGDLNVFRQ